MIARPSTNAVLSNMLRRMTCPICGRRYGGNSSTKAEGIPFRSVLLRKKEANSVMLTARRISRKTKRPAAHGFPRAKKIPARRISVGNRPLQGTKELVRMAMSRSLGDSMMRQAVTPAALQPKPMHMSNALLGCQRNLHSFLLTLKPKPNIDRLIFNPFYVFPLMYLNSVNQLK